MKSQLSVFKTLHRTLKYEIAFVWVALLICGSGTTQAQTVDSPWPMEGHDQRNTRQSTNKGPDQGIQLEWRYQIKGDAVPVSTPTIGSDGTIYVASSDRYLYALAPTGSLKWRYHAEESVSAATIGSDGTIYMATAGQLKNNVYTFHVIAIDTLGTIKWQYPLNGSRGSSPVVSSDGTIYVASGIDYSGVGYLYALNSVGNQKWTYQTASGIYGPPAISGDGTVYVSSTDTLYALTSSGTLRWKWSTTPESSYGLDLISQVVGEDGTIYVGSNGTFHTYVYALTPDGNRRWGYETEDDIQGMAIGSDGRLYVPSGLTYWQKFEALNPDGTAASRLDMDPGYCSSPITINRGKPPAMAGD